MQQNLKGFIRQISKEKDLEIEIIKEAIEQAIVSASKKTLSHFENARPDLDVETGELKIFAEKTAVKQVTTPRHEITLEKARQITNRAKLGDVVEVEIDPGEFGRIAAQSVRQGILQRLRDAERENIYEEYKDRVGQVVTGIVQRFERRDAIVSFGKVEAVLPLEEIPYGIRYRFGDRLKLIIVEVKKSTKGPQVCVSRTRPELVMRLFEQEVPEISDGTVKIVGMAREPGIRTKVAVTSTNPDVDPVGACVGMRGSRVQMIVRELENEKIDIIPYSSDPKTFITNALNPAEIIKVNLNLEEKYAQVIVAKDGLSVAIGKKGQNAKLAAKLSGYKVDIKSEVAEAEALAAKEIRRRYLEDFLSQIDGLPEPMRDAITASTLDSVEKIAEAKPEQLVETIGPDSIELVERLIEGAKEYTEALKEMAAELAAGESDSSQEAPAETAALQAEESEPMQPVQTEGSEITTGDQQGEPADTDETPGPAAEAPQPVTAEKDGQHIEKDGKESAQSGVTTPEPESQAVPLPEDEAAQVLVPEEKSAEKPRAPLKAKRKTPKTTQRSKSTANAKSRRKTKTADKKIAAAPKLGKKPITK
jgi:N utilization substance protein A